MVVSMQWQGERLPHDQYRLNNVGTKALPLSESAWKVRYKPAPPAHATIFRLIYALLTVMSVSLYSSGEVIQTPSVLPHSSPVWGRDAPRVACADVVPE